MVADPFYSLLIRHQHLSVGDEIQSALHTLIAFRLESNREQRMNDPEVALAAMAAYDRMGFATRLWVASVVGQYCRVVLHEPEAGPRVCRELARLKLVRCTVEEAGQEIHISLQCIRSRDPQSV